MPAKVISFQFTPQVFNKQAPAPVALKVWYDSAPVSAQLKLNVPGGKTVALAKADASGKIFTCTLAPADLLAVPNAPDVYHQFIGMLATVPGDQTTALVTTVDILKADMPPVTIRSAGAGVQYSEHLVNIQWPTLPNSFLEIGAQQHMPAIAKKFYTVFGDDYDFLQIVFARAFIANRAHFATRSGIQGIGNVTLDTADFGSASRLIGITRFPIPQLFDGGSVAAVHELGHQWINYLDVAPLNAKFHWPLSDLAGDIMGYSLAGGEGGDFNYTLQAVSGGDFKTVPNNLPKEFSDLGLYLMGLLPSSQVGPHFVFNDQKQTPVPNGILKGPVTPVTIQMVTKGIERVPDAAHSPKRFRVATILVTENGLASADAMRFYDFMAARGGAKTLLADSSGGGVRSKPFQLATKGLARLNPRIKLNILVDASRDGGTWWAPQPQAGPFNANAPHQGKALADHLRSLNHFVTEIAPPAAINSALLADRDIVIRAGGRAAYAAAEIAAYDAWVRDGGNLLLLLDHHPNDPLAAHFGLQFQGAVLGKRMLSSFVPHPLTSGVAPLFYEAGCGLTKHPADAIVVGRLSADSFLDLNNNGAKDAGEPVAPDGLGVMPVGLGRIVFCGDVNLWELVPQPLVKNTLSYLMAA
jgi:hypothetical protein